MRDQPTRSKIVHDLDRPATEIGTLKMYAARSFETLVSYHITTRCHNTQDHDINLHSLENLESRGN